MKRFTLALVFAILGLFALLAAGCGGGGAKNDEIVLGVYGSLTGGEATFGQSTQNGVAVAIEQLTAEHQGKIGGLPVRMVSEDDQSKAEEAVNAVQKLINQDRVVALIGEVASSRSMAAAPVAQSNGVPMISPSSTNPEVTKKGDYIFRTCFLDDFQGRCMARFTADTLKLKKVAVLKDVKSDYSVGLAKFFTDEFVNRGGTVLVEQSYSSGDQDFRAQLTKIKAKAPEAIIVPGYYTEAGLIVRQARELGLTMPVIGGDGWESSKLIEIGGEAMNGCYYTNHWSLDEQRPSLQAFLTRYRAKFNGDPDAIGGLAYDAANILIQAMTKLATDDPKTFAALGSSKAGTDDRKAATKKIRDLIAATSNYDGVTGNITLDANRDATKPAVVIAIKGGKKVYDCTINP